MAVQVLADLVRSKRPSVVYLIETFVDKQRMETIRVHLGFDCVFTVDADGHSGGLALLWNNTVDLRVTGYSSNHVDTEVRLDVGSPCWRFTGFYGYPQRQRRREAWDLLRSLSVRSRLPWAVMGDYNDLLDQFEKRGRFPHPEWLINGFREAVADSGLQDVPFGGHQYTWVKSRGTDRMLEEKLDRILSSDGWLDLFGGVRALSLTVPYSDHRPLMLTPVSLPTVRRRARFCFDNMWLREEACREIVAHSWDRTVGLDTLARVEACARDIARWGRHYNKDFQWKIEQNKRRLDLLSSRRDGPGMREYEVVEKNLIFLLEQQHSFWKQRAKEFWYKGGDVNNKFFHNSVKARRRKNTFKRLQDEDGNWVVDEAGLDNVMLNYFTSLFSPDYGDFQEVIETISAKVTGADNARLLHPLSMEEVRIAVFQMHPDKSPGPDGFGPGFFHVSSEEDGPGDDERSSRRNKVCANRLKPLLQSLISGAQSAFIPGRLITDNIMLAYEVHHHLKRKAQGRQGVVALKLDMSKAYDRVEW
ncbi:PREDICTED: uncharacterized protein LOC109158536 [Ipomoea nil]|uniref:uncharacterized protein LOC109158536 n=1 Tax=Ipomoea nil TaxID=35883 RepID=UPI0009015340|nr:PREDICTED: uncharacterized protein LOC109158536 [Ipomoea nil]